MDKEVNELLLIYKILRKLDYNFLNSNNDSLFPKRFILKLLNERLEYLNEICQKLVENLFNKLINQPERINNQELSYNNDNKLNLFTTRCFELDEYFHYSLYYLHDFIIELNWFEPIELDYPIDESNNNYNDQDVDYVRKKLPFIEDFFIFRKKLIELKYLDNLENKKGKINNNNDDLLSKKISPKRVSYSPEQTTTLKITDNNNNKLLVKNKIIKSSLSIGTNLSGSNLIEESPSKKRRIRFKETSIDDLNLIFSRRNRDLKDSHSILALDLLIYSLKLFIKNLYSKLILNSNELLNELIEFMELIKNSRQKIRTKKLNFILIKVKKSIFIHLTIIENLFDLKKIYLQEFLLTVLSANDSLKLLNFYKKPHINTFIQSINFEFENEVSSYFAELHHFLELVQQNK